MSVFAILSAPPLGGDGIEELIAAKYPEGEWLRVTDSFWLVADSGIAKDVSDKVGISSNPEISGIVVTISGYYGRAANHIWEWIALKSSPRVDANAAA